MSRRALIACANHWRSPITVGDHHLARDLVRRGWEVAFVSSPISPLHLGKARPNRERFECYFAGGYRDCADRLWCYVPGTLVPPRRGWPGNRTWFLDNWWRATFPPVVGRVRDEGFASVDLLYLRDARQAFWLDRVEATSIVYRVADRDSGFAGYSNALRAQEETIARRADLVVYTARDLEQYVLDLGARYTMELPNGVDFEHFRVERAAPPEFREDPRPIAIYVGSIDAWLDRRLIEHALRALPEVRFVFIGPGDLGSLEAFAREQYPNLEVLGPRAYVDVPGYLQHAHVGIIPFDVHNHRELVSSVQPLKLFEYLASGIPVVSTDWPALAALESPAYRSRDPESFVENVRAALGEGRSQRADRIRFASQHAWSARFDRLLAEIGFNDEAFVG